VSHHYLNLSVLRELTKHLSKLPSSIALSAERDRERERGREREKEVQHERETEREREEEREEEVQHEREREKLPQYCSVSRQRVVWAVGQDMTHMPGQASVRQSENVLYGTV
jgi:hypothetical protein